MTTDYEANLERRLAALTETTERLSARVDALEKALQQQAPPTSSAATPVLARSYGDRCSPSKSANSWRIRPRTRYLAW